MSMQADFERLHKRALRKRLRRTGETVLKKTASAPHDGDLAVKITNDKAMARARAKFGLLRRGRR